MVRVERARRVISGVMLGLVVFVMLLTSEAAAADLQTGRWVGDFSVGIIGNTTDATAFVFNLGFDRYLTEQFTLGPLLQLGATGDLVQTALSGQAKYWIDLVRGEHPLRVAPQAGIGFVQADQGRSDTSWLFPIGVELEYVLTSELRLSSTVLLNFVDLDTGVGTTSIMPSFTVGVRF